VEQRRDLATLARRRMLGPEQPSKETLAAVRRPHGNPGERRCLDRPVAWHGDLGRPGPRRPDDPVPVERAEQALDVPVLADLVGDLRDVRTLQKPGRLSVEPIHELAVADRPYVDAHGRTISATFGWLVANRRRAKENAVIDPSSHPVNVAMIDRAPLGARVADRVTGFLGSWRFLIIQTAIVSAWLAGNAWLLSRPFDPYPFILLNLAFSTQAAYAAPLILLAGNRAALRDRLTLEHAAAEADIEDAQNHEILAGNVEILRRVEGLEKRILELETSILAALGERPPDTSATRRPGWVDPPNQR
jgi:uncharacterized membrane protein